MLYLKKKKEGECWRYGSAVTNKPFFFLKEEGKVSIWEKLFPTVSTNDLYQDYFKTDPSRSVRKSSLK